LINCYSYALQQEMWNPIIGNNRPLKPSMPFYRENSNMNLRPTKFIRS